MRKLLYISFLITGIYLIHLIYEDFMFASTYSVVSEESPFGIVAVWKPDIGYMHNYHDSLWRLFYKPKIEKALNIGFSYNRPNLMYYDPNYVFINKNGLNDFSKMDSFVVFMQECNLKILACVFPKNFSEYNQYPLFNDDSIAYYWWWRVVVERYDGDGEGMFLPVEWGGDT